MSIDTTEAPVPAPMTGAAPRNYWGADETKDIFLPDGVQYFRVQKMNEGAKTKFQKLTNQDMVVDRNNEARVKVDPAAERHALLNSSIIGWNLYEFPENGEPYPAMFSKQQLTLWLDKADPKLVSDIEYEIRMFNPWMLNEMPLEEIDKEIDRLYDMKKRKQEEAAGESSSTTK